MKKRITALALAIFMVLGTVALAAGTEKNITVTPMTLSINGQVVTPTKSNGEAAQVFAYDGATYAPIRYIAELLGIQVDWDKNDPNSAKLEGVPGMPSAPKAALHFTAGTYTAEAQGNNGPVKVELTVSADAITAVKVTEQAETPSIAGPALERIKNSCIKEMVLLDTIPEKEGAKEARITMLPVATVFAEAIARIYADKPVSPLFT